MSTSAAVTSPAVKGTPRDRLIGICMAAFAVVEAVITFFIVIKPLYIVPVYVQRNEYIKDGTSCMVKLFGKTFASEEEIFTHKVILSMVDTIINIILIYVVITGLLLILSFCYYKGYAFAKSYLIALFGAKFIVGLVPSIVPYDNFTNTIRIFGAVDAVICLAACVYFIYESSLEYISDMLLDNDQILAMKKRGFVSALTLAGMAAYSLCTSFAMSAYGSSFSIYLGWQDSSNRLSDTSVAQGLTLLGLLIVALIASILYIREGDWAMLYYISFGGVAASIGLWTLINRILWIFTTYMPQKNLANSGDEAAQQWVASNGMTTSWFITTVLLVVSIIGAALAAVFAFTRIAKKMFMIRLRSAGDSKAFIAVIIGCGSLVLSCVFSLVAVTLWDKEHWDGFAVGAMDYMYFMLYIGITLFLAGALWCGYSFTKFGTLGLYLVVASCNFSTIFAVFGERSAKVAATEGYKGINYIISGALFILSIIACLAIIVLFVIKEVNDYLYQKRFS